jgi:hypothetical protein
VEYRYGADSSWIDPAVFREDVCGLPSWEHCPAAENARDSRSQKLYLDYTAQKAELDLEMQQAKL